MAKNTETIKYDKERLLKKYEKAIRDEDFYNATLIYNRLKDLSYETKMDDGEIDLKQSYMYSQIGSQFSEADNLLKVASKKSFYKYNPKAVALRLSMFFNVYYEQDCLDYYLEMFKARGREFAEIDKPSFVNKNLNKSIHFVEEDGFYKMGEAINHVTRGRADLAMQTIDDIAEDDASFAKAQNFKASFLVVRHEFDEAKAILFKLVQEKKADEETFRALFCLPNLTEDEMRYLVEALDRMRGETNWSDSLTSVEASLLLNLKEGERALNLLNSVSSKTRFEESFLTLKARCHHFIQDKEGLINSLKMLYTLYPNVPTARLALIKLEDGEEFDIDPYIASRPTKSIKKEIKRYLSSIQKESIDINKQSAEETRFLLKLAEGSGDFLLLRRVTKLVLRSKYKALVQDAMISVYTHPQNIQIMLQAVIEERTECEWFFLQFAHLKSMPITYPEFFSEEVGDKEKYEFLLTSYAQSLTLAFFENADVSKFGEVLNGLVKRLYETDLDNFPALKYSDNLTFLMLTYAFPEDEMLLELFFKMPEELKAEILKFLK